MILDFTFKLTTDFPKLFSFYFYVYCDKILKRICNKNKWIAKLYIVTFESYVCRYFGNGSLCYVNR